VTPTPRHVPLVLASASPRRAQLLEQAGIPFQVDVSDIEEILDPAWSPAEAVVELARQKARDVAVRYPGGEVVLAADTVVVVEGRIHGKPRDEADARRMLAALSDRWHEVYTGWCLVLPEGERVGVERTDVHFAPLDEETIARYVATGEPLDKAGAYAIQGRGSLFVDAIRGDYHNVVGLPVHAIGRALLQSGFLVI
jgi:septum formation protein